MLKSFHRIILAAFSLLFLATAPVVAQSSKKIYYVAAANEAKGDGSSWQSPTKLSTALSKAVAGDEVWVKGYLHVTDTTVYHAPKDGYQLRSGVKLYGGFYGDETSSANAPVIDEGKRRYAATYQSVIIADESLHNDSVPANYIIYPENPTRKDNSRHCLVMNIGVSDDNKNESCLTTTVRGLVLAGGNASGDIDSDDGHGGGILVVNRSTHAGDLNADRRTYEISQCYFVNNYGQRGGAIYVDPSVTNTDPYANLIRYCCIYNNASGSRSNNLNCGAGAWLGGGAILSDSEIFNNTGGGVRISDKAKVVNCTVAHNTITAVDLVDASTQGSVPTKDGGGTLYNTVLWGSYTLSKTETKPAFRNCAYPEVTIVDDGKDDDGNVYISWTNFTSDEAAAWFVTPTSNVGYDRIFSIIDNQTPAYDFQVEYQSALIDAGNSTWYSEYVSSKSDLANDVDLAGNNRTYNNHPIDIGAYEREELAVGRRLYVATTGDDNNDGLSWDTPKRNPQTAIDLLAQTKGRKGEVWIATGTYNPEVYMVSDDKGNRANTAPLAFQMRDGISVYGGFHGKTDKLEGETSLSDRQLGSSGQVWDFRYPTILQGKQNTSLPANWNTTDEVWKVASNSYHVVWFAPNPHEAKSLSDYEFHMSTILDGVIIERGAASSNGTDDFEPLKGTGVFMFGSNNILRRCVVRDNSGVLTGKETIKGGGVYCMFGQVRYSLIHNNSASEGGGIYVDTEGFINNSMIANNSAERGAGVYLERGTFDGMDNFQILATSIITNNTSTQNGAVYANGSGLVEQCTIANNYTSNVTDAGSTSGSTSYTAGLYVNRMCTAVNNILWNNTLRQGSSSSSKKYSASLANIYATGHTRSTALFYSNAVSEINAVNWSDIYQSGSYELKTVEFALDTASHSYTKAEDFTSLRGVQATWHTIDYFWKTRAASTLRNRGMLYGQLPQDLVFKPSTDFTETNFQSQPPIGPYISTAPEIIFDHYSKPNTLRLYFDDSGATPQGNASSWANAYTSLNDLLSFASTMMVEGNINVMSSPDTQDDYTIDENDTIEILVRAGDIQPSLPYTFQENDPRSCSFNVKASDVPVVILGGYPSRDLMPEPTDADRDPSKYRTVFTGNADGTALDEGLYHVFRVETGADVTLDGVTITRGYAAGTAYNPQGAAVLIGSLYAVDARTHVTLRNCIIENNSAHYGPAVAAMNDLRNGKLTLTNCVINNNQSDNQDIIYTYSPTNVFTLNHVSIINNIGVAPKDMGATSFAAGNMTFDADHNFSLDKSNNTISIATTGKEGAANFANPSNKVGAAFGGNVYYGGNTCYRPLTSSKDCNAIINQALSTDGNLSTDIVGNERNLGGAPDLGAYEALLPKAGKVIYVRSYNTDWTENDCIDGTPDFNILKDNPSNVYDGLTWSRAIQGNAVCDTAKVALANGQYDLSNSMYVLDSDGKMLAATLDNTKYGADYNARTAPYGQTSNAYSEFFSAATSSSANGNYEKQTRADNRQYNKITNNRNERYVSGLQIAVEKAARYNAAHKNDADFEEMSVWVGAGVYTDFKGFVIRNGVKVYGGFPKDGNPGETDRRPLLSQYIPARKDYKGLNKSDYETILQIRKETPVYLTKSSRELWWSEGKPSDGSDYDFIQKLVNSGKVERHYVLYQPDVCTTTWNINGSEQTRSLTSQDTYRYPGFGDGTYADKQYYQEYSGVKWDGFSIRHGYITNYRACRDGGAGLRSFRGSTFENLIIVNNLTHGPRARGGGLYMDGDQSVIFNSFMLRNMCFGYSKQAGDGDCYGGGAYMIQGIGYNLVVASNRAKSSGGGIFIESAKFYNNTVCHNMSESKEGTGIMHWQNKNKDLTGIVSSLTLYNCLLYDNMQNGGKTDGVSQVGSRAADMFNRAYHCYVNGPMGALASKFSKADGNITLDNYSSVAYPFEVEGNDKRWSSSQRDSIDGGVRFSTARRLADYRLKEKDGLAGNPCLNGGTVDMPTIPATDMDYTDRIKDCTIDIGAYEADNSSNIKPQAKTRKKTVTTTTATGGTTTKEVDETYYVYYVTETGYGNRSGSDPENAACAEKLQSVLTSAGHLADSLDYKYKVYVKVAGYQPDDDGDRFVYHANTLADPSDPQSYTFLVPQGVWMMGGYNEGTWQTTTTGSGTSAVTTRKLVGYNWDNDARDVITDYQTVLSAKTQPKQGSAVGEVTGYHVVAFGKWPKGEISDYYKHALPGKTVDGKLVNPTAGIDGVRLIDGSATDDSGFNGMGGGAVVPAYAHVRNCVITGCEALRGGAVAVLPGALLSGSVIHDNKARLGGAVYAANGDITDGTASYRAYIASCTICANQASTGGGIFQELGAAFVGNSVIWGNTASADKNVSGVFDITFKDFIHHSPDETSTVEDYYPYNNNFVEQRKLPANTENTQMTSDFETYFASTGEYYPRPYSQLIDNGVTKDYQQLWVKLGVATHDVKGVARGAKDRLTAGAYAITLPEVDNHTLLKRLFVSWDGGAEVSDELKAKYVGRSFYTPFNSIDAALAYIKHARSNNIGTEAKPRYLASDTTHFEILVSGGTYTPSVAREDSDVVGTTVIDRRLQSFDIPVNVAVFGSFESSDNYSSDPVAASATTTIETFDRLLVGNKEIDLRPNMPIDSILLERNTNHREDLNKNGILEPWEFANPTVLNGDIKKSEKERKVYHVVYSRISDSNASSAERNNDVMLDAITIINGETSDGVANDNGTEDGEEVNDEGHGGGIFSYNVNYTLSRCRVMANKGIHGGGIFVHDGSLDLIGCFIAGNWAGSETNQSAATATGKGGGICADFSSYEMGNVHALNCIFANNTAGNKAQADGAMGGAIFIKVGGTESDNNYRVLNVTNCLVVRNRAPLGPEIAFDDNLPDEDAPVLVYNTAFWGNVSPLYVNSDGSYKKNAHMMLFDNQMSHCALEVRGQYPYETSTRAASENIIIDHENMSARGPRFKQPSTEAGDLGFDYTARWNPASISVLTDAGLGTLPACEDEEYVDTYKEVIKNPHSMEEDAYLGWWEAHKARLAKYGYTLDYIDLEPKEEKDKNGNVIGEKPRYYRRYMGPLDENTGKQGVRPIDIGMYEFQYKFSFPDMEAVYIGTTEQGDGSGENWENQSADLLDAIIAMANPSGNIKETEAGYRTDRRVFVRDGEYYSPVTTGGDAFSLIVNAGKDLRKYVTSVEIVGACTGNGLGDDAEQNFANQTVIVPNPQVESNQAVTNLLNITTNGRPVKISGLTFKNTHKYTGASSDKGGRGINVDINNDAIDSGGKLTLANCGFRENIGNGLNVMSNQGELLVYNTLFADGQATGMAASGKTTAVNVTFAKNAGADYTTAEGGTTDIVNSVSWENGTQNLVTDDDEWHNTAFAKGTANDDVMNGPNFADPAKGDYSIMPGLKLFNTGDSTLYINKVKGIDPVLSSHDYFSAERDLANAQRLTGSYIDRGAYECESKLLPIIYVKTGVASYGSGESWQQPLGSLQSAVNLAELYANVGNQDKDGKKCDKAYVFVDRNATSEDVNITLPGVKVYGGMNGESSKAGGDTEPADFTSEQTAAVVADLLWQRGGIIEQAKQSRLSNLTMGYELGDGTDKMSQSDCAVDGFYADGTLNVNRGYLSTSIVAPTATVTGSADGTLYNSLALGKVEKVRTVNVTAVKSDGVEGSGSLPDISDSKGNGCAANRANATVVNKYVSDDYWKWQLNDFLVNGDGSYDYSKLNSDINANADSTQTVRCADAVGHRRDLAGNLRLRVFPGLTGDDLKYNNVDNGCFETWYVPTTYYVTPSDRPLGKSVVYVREEQRSDDDKTMEPFHELRIAPDMYTESNPFTPGFLLLKHHAGLRGNGNYILLYNYAVERELHVQDVTAEDGSVTKKGFPDLVVMPFVTTVREQYVDGKLYEKSEDDLYDSYGYDGDVRAAYDYKFDRVNGEAWSRHMLSTDLTTTGLMIVPKQDVTLRFYAGYYVERPSFLTVSLPRHLKQQPWSTSTTGSVKFTHKENMGWNLFGSPYLCAMNYKDLQYDRMLYIDNILTDGSFTPLYTMDSDGNAIDGYIPAFDAVFTQTAALDKEETFTVSHSPAPVGEPYQGARTLSVSLSRVAAVDTRADGSAASDNLWLNAVDASAAHTGFDMTTDGVKWMATDAPQLYAQSGEGRYSLLSAVSRDGEVKVGVSVPAEGTYMFALPDDCDTDGYEAVMLKDSERGTAVDLLDGAYQFTAQKAGEMNKRFTISFHKTAGGVSRVSVSRTSPTRVSVSGLQDGDEVRVYAPDGRIVNMQRASSDKLSMSVTTRGVLIVEVTRDGKQVGVRKV